MAIRNTTCPKCEGRMEAGFIPDRTYGDVVVSNWVEGPPERRRWSGIRLKDKRQFPITTWRCRACGFLECYAAE